MKGLLMLKLEFWNFIIIEAFYNWHFTFEFIYYDIKTSMLFFARTQTALVYAKLESKRD